MACKLCASATAVVGSVKQMKVEIKDENDALIDPGTLVFKLRAPDDTLTTYTYGPNPQLQRQETGVYFVNYKVDQAGIWAFRFETTGAGEGASEDSFEVARSSF